MNIKELMVIPEVGLVSPTPLKSNHPGFREACEKADIRVDYIGTDKNRFIGNLSGDLAQALITNLRVPYPLGLDKFRPSFFTQAWAKFDSWEISGLHYKEWANPKIFARISSPHFGRDGEILGTIRKLSSDYGNILPLRKNRSEEFVCLPKLNEELAAQNISLSYESAYSPHSCDFTIIGTDDEKGRTLEMKFPAWFLEYGDPLTLGGYPLRLVYRPIK